MPHLTLEYTRNLAITDIGQCLLELNRVLIDSGHFDEIDIKSRAVGFDDFLIGASSEGRAFAHVKLAILSGRSMDTKRALSNMLLERLQQLCGRDGKCHVQLCVEVLEIERDSYAKTAFSS